MTIIGVGTLMKVPTLLIANNTGLPFPIFGRLQIQSVATCYLAFRLVWLGLAGFNPVPATNLTVRSLRRRSVDLLADWSTIHLWKNFHLDMH